MVLVTTELTAWLTRYVVRGCVALSALSTAACANVAAYDRGQLAHPTMSPVDMAGPAEEHTRAVQEGAVGGGFGAGGGCGCN